MIFDWSEIGSYFVEVLFEFILDMLNLACEPILNLIRKLLSEAVSISIFSGVWATIVYVLSMFYGLSLVWIGFKFIVSEGSPEKREEAKDDLKNTIIMMILIQGSYHLYELILAVSSALTRVILNLINSSFFHLKLAEGFNFGFDLIWAFFYVISLMIVLVILLLRYLSVSSGVIFFPIGILCYFFSPLSQYGKLIINWTMTLIFIPLFFSIIFLIGDKVSHLSAFKDFKTLIMVGSLNLIIISTLLILLFVAIKAAFQINKVKKVITLSK